MSGLVFDDTALVALFDAHPYVTQLWRHAGHELVDVLVPATAILAANRRLEETDEAWSLVLDGDNMLVLDLTMTRALAASRLGADLVTAHVSVEARDADAMVVTARPLDYPPDLRTVEFRTF